MVGIGRGMVVLFLVFWYFIFCIFLANYYFCILCSFVVFTWYLSANVGTTDRAAPTINPFDLSTICLLFDFALCMCTTIFAYY